MLSRCALLVLIVGVAALPASADLLWYQAPGPLMTVAAQDWPDVPVISMWEFDDFVVGGSGWLVNQVTIYGYDIGAADQNVDELLAFTSKPGKDAIGTTYSGTQTGADLVFDLPDIYLAPGTQWLSGWVVRPSKSGGKYYGQYFWERCEPAPVNGSEHWFHNPGGALPFGSDPVPGSTVFATSSDLAFRIEGRQAGGPPVPELPPLALAALGLVPLGLRFRKRRR